MIKAKVVLVTGATGFIGSNLIRRLLFSGMKLHILTRNNSNLWRISNIKDKLTIHKLDFTNKTELIKVVKLIQPQIVYNFSAYGNSSSQKNVDEMIKVNITNVHGLLEALNTINYELFIHTGSSSEYGFKDIPMKEDQITEPNSFYSATKTSGTLICQTYAKLYQKPIVIMRPFSVYGYYEEKNRLIPTAIMSCLLNKEFNLTNSIVNHDFIFIEDVIDVYLQVISNKQAAGEIFNVGTGKQYTNEEVVETIMQIVGKRVKIHHTKASLRSWDAKNWRADISKAEKLLNWQPKNTLKMGLKKTVNWFKENMEYYS